MIGPGCGEVMVMHDFQWLLSRFDQAAMIVLRVFELLGLILLCWVSLRRQLKRITSGSKRRTGHAENRGKQSPS